MTVKATWLLKAEASPFLGLCVWFLGSPVEPPWGWGQLSFPSRDVPFSAIKLLRGQSSS